MKVPETELTGNTDCVPSQRGGRIARLQDQVVAVRRRAEAWVNSLRLHIRPRVSLLAGSVLVLITLYLPTAVGSCGSPEPGFKLASGNADVTWPSWFLFSSPEIAGRFFYLFCLLVAAFTVLFLLASAINRKLVRNRGLLTGLIAITGLIALFSTTDMFGLAYFIQIGLFFSYSVSIPIAAFILLVFLVPAALLRPEFRTTKGMVALVFILAGIVSILYLGGDNITLLVLLGLLPVACLRPEFWTKKGGVAWVFILAGAGSALWLGFYLLDRICGGCEVPDHLFFLTNPFAIAFSFLPLVSWLRHVRPGRTPSRHWPDLARRLAIFYAGAVTVDFLGIVEFSLWGLISFLLGLYLIFFGYWQLRRAANESLPIQSRTYADAAT